MSVSKTAWGKAPSGESVFLYSLSDEIDVTISNYGGTITSIRAPDRRGVKGDVVLGFDKIEGYIGSPFYHGATIGRYANRIGKGLIEIDDESYQLPLNDGVNHLHGGFNGFDKKVWSPEVIGESSLRLSYQSKDGEEGYPGNLDASVTFTVIEDKLEMDYLAQTDKPTIVNLTNHAYFNLGSDKTILNHRLWLDADQYTPVDENLIPIGPHEGVEDTPFDFREPKKVGDRIEEKHPQLIRANGYDQNYVLNQVSNPQVSVTDPVSGRVLEISTTMPGVQFYTGNFLDGQDKGRRGVIGFRSGLCLETQFFPDFESR